MKKTLTLAVCTALLGVAACSANPPARRDHDRGDDRAAPTSPSTSPGAKPSSSASPGLPPESRFTVPEGFDTGDRRAWTEAVTEPDSRSHGSWALAPASGMVVQVTNNEGLVHARRVDGGAEVWTFTTPTPLDKPRTDVYVATDAEGEEIAVVVRDGTTPDDGVSRARPMVTVDTVPMDSTGTARHRYHLEYPDGEVDTFTNGLLVTDRAGGRTLALDLTTGRGVEVSATGEVELTSCRTGDLPPSAVCSADTEPRFATRAGTISTFAQNSYCDFRWREGDHVPCTSGFTVGDAWTSADVAPQGAADATVLAVVDRYLVVDWTKFPNAPSQELSKQDVVAVHDLSSGRLVASVECDVTNADAGTASVSTLSAQVLTQLSGNGRYLVSGQVGFDLDRKQGRCFAGTAQARGVNLTAVGNNGRAFGVTYDDSRWSDVPYGTFPHDFGADEAPVPARTVEVDLAAGTTRALPKGTAVPVFLTDRAGLFLRNGTLGAYPVR